MTSKLKKGEVRNLIRLPEHYGEKVTIGGRRVIYAPAIDVTVYKDKWGRYTVLEKGHRLTPAEKKLGLKRTRSAEAKFIKKLFPNELAGIEIDSLKASLSSYPDNGHIKLDRPKPTSNNVFHF